MAVQSMPVVGTDTALWGAARRLTVSPEAIPMRRRPKSKARMTWAGALGMTCYEAHAGAVHSQQLPGRLPAILERQAEDDVLVHRQAQPGVIEHFALELTGFPARITERHEGILRTCAAGDGREHVAR